MNTLPEHQPLETKERNTSLNRELESQNEKLKNELDSKAEAADRNRPNIEQLQKSVEKQAISGSETKHSNQESNKNHPIFVNKQLKEMAYSRTMTRVRKRLSVPAKALSKLVHSKLLDKPSEIAGNTIARPSGMLGGASIAFAGSLALLWITRKYGYEYNYLAIMMLFGIGLALGLLTELLIKVFRIRKKS